MNAKDTLFPSTPGAADHASSIQAAELADALQQAGEIAVVDVRELARHVDDGHLIHSAPLPLSVLEIRAPSLIPRKTTPVVVYDADGGALSALAARRLRALGYTGVRVLSGGVDGWRADGREVYTGLHVLSKAFGEFVEHTYGTPHIPPDELKTLLDDGSDVVLLDGRNLEEFYKFSIPGAHACPNAELPYRVHDLVSSDRTLVVVSCAGRTRSIIGAQALINTGLPNRVVALENGAMAWFKAGYPLRNQHSNPAPAPSDAGRDKSRQAARALRERFAIASIDSAGLQALRDDSTRSLYVLDVRTAAEFEAGHLPGSLWAEGGQLVQATDKWIATRHARIVLVDNGDGVRSAITASWLIQLGWNEVHTYALQPARDTVQPSAAPSPAAAGTTAASDILPRDLHARLDADTIALFDFSPSPTYRAGHIPGARFALRSRIDARLEEALAGRDIAIVAADPVLAALAAEDIRAQTGREVFIVKGGTQAWQDAGLPLSGEAEADWHDAPDDVWLSPYFREDRIRAFDTYIEWETGLIDQIRRDPSVSFQPFHLDA